MMAPVRCSVKRVRLLDPVSGAASWHSGGCPRGAAVALGALRPPLVDRVVEVRGDRPGKLDGHLDERPEAVVGGAPVVPERLRTGSKLAADRRVEVGDEAFAAVEERGDGLLPLDRRVVARAEPRRAKLA